MFMTAKISTLSEITKMLLNAKSLLWGLLEEFAGNIHEPEAENEVKLGS